MFKLTGAYWIKNEAPYLAEYIEFHLLQGFDHFIFYDNKSTDNTVEVLTPYIKRGLVELRQYPPHVTQRNNFWMMNHLIKEQEGLTEWIHFHAIDERIFSPTGKKLPEILKDYKQYGGLCVGWEEFNSNGHQTKTPGLITDRFTTTCLDTAQHIKTIIRPECVTGHEGDPHNFKFKVGFTSVDENKKPVSGPWNTKNPYTLYIVRNHHYRTLSREEFDNKMNKGLLDHAGQENVRRHDAERQWKWCHEQAYQETNTMAQAYSEQVKENLRVTYKDGNPLVYEQVKLWYNL